MDTRLASMERLRFCGRANASTPTAVSSAYRVQREHPTASREASHSAILGAENVSATACHALANCKPSDYAIAATIDGQ